MAEKEYIDRNAVIEEIESLSVTVTGLRAIKNLLTRYAKHYKDSVVKVLSDVPAADVVEVVHGEWIEDYTRQFFDESCETGYHCSRCNRTVAVAHELYDTKGRGLLHNLYPYCHCGAKMDKENLDG